REQAKQASVLSRFMLDELATRHDLSEAEGRAACVHEALPLLASLSDSTLSTQIQHEFAQLVRLTEDELQLRLLQQQKPVYDRERVEAPVSSTRVQGESSVATTNRKPATADRGKRARSVT